MIILTIRTDKPEAELGLFADDTKLAYENWQAHRELAETIHGKIRGLLEGQQLTLHDLGGIVAFRGPGSFTGLRIGLSVANALADSLSVARVGAMGTGWITSGTKRLMDGESDTVIMPEYGAPVHITAQKK